MLDLPDHGLDDDQLAATPLWDLARWRARFEALHREATVELGAGHPVARKAFATYRRVLEELAVREAQVWPR